MAICTALALLSEPDRTPIAIRLAVAVALGLLWPLSIGTALISKILKGSEENLDD